MKKQITALALGVFMTFGCVTNASAAEEPKTELKMPETQTKTITLADEDIGVTQNLSSDVTVQVTYTGVIGEIDAKDTFPDKEYYKDRKIVVVKEGSEVQFKITSNDPGASYNFCYDKIAYDPGYGGESTL